VSRPLEDQDARTCATTDLARSLSVEASAGTGKTSLIVGRVVALIETGTAAIREMAVITFTEKAAAELEERVRLGIEKRLDALRGGGAPPGDEAAARLAQAHGELDQASIQTIHAFATSLLRRRPVEAGVDPRFTVADAAGQRFLFDETWERYIAERAAGENAPLACVIAASVTLDGLRDLARRFVENRDLSVDGGPPRVPAAEGAQGRARELHVWLAAKVAELAPLCRDPQDKLLVNLRDVLAFAQEIAGLPEFRARRALLGEPKKKISRSFGKAGAWLRDGKSLVQRVAVEWEERFGAFREASDRHVTGEAAFFLHGFLEAYETRKKREGVLDFQDLLLLARRLLRQPRIADELRRSVRFVLVDEFQDTDPLQVEIAALLTGTGEGAAWTDRAPLPGALFFVGDPKQSIYRFRRADLRTYNEARAWLDQTAGGQGEITITANFRSRPGITAFVNATFGKIFTGLEETPIYSRLDPQRRESSEEAVAFLIPGEDATAAAPGAKRDHREKREDEAAMIARALRRGIEEKRWKVGAGNPPGGDPEDERERGAGYGDVAMLLRSFTDVGLYEEALQDEGIPCQTAMGRRYFLRPEVAWFASLLRAVESPHDEVAVVAALRSPFFGFPDEALLLARMTAGRFDPLRPEAAGGETARALDLLGRWHRERNDAPAGVFVRRLLHESSALALLALREDGERSLLNLLKIADLARRHESDGGTFRTFARWLARARSEEFEQPDSTLVEASRGAVQILTIHAAKGLEFPIVVLPDLVRKVPVNESFLIDRASGKIAFRLEGRKEGQKEASFRSADYERLMEGEKPILAAERQRLLYVAATRARDLLVIPLPEPAAKPMEESFLGDLAKGEALPDAAALAGARDGSALALRNGARARLERIDVSAPAGAGRGVEAPDAERRDAPPATLPSWRRDRDALLEEAGKPPAFLTASGGRETAPEPEEGLAARAGSRAALVSDLPGVSLEEPADGGARLAEGAEGVEALEDVDSVVSIDGAESVEGLDGAGGVADEKDAEDAARARAQRARVRIEEARNEKRRTARRFGIAVHAVLEAADLSDPSSLGALAEWQARVQRLPGEAARIERAARGALALPAVVESRGRTVRREVPVAFLEDGVLVEGQIDFVAEREDGSLLVADFKTDAVRSIEEARERARAYAPQLALYARALERATGRRVSETAVLFVAEGHEIRAPHDERARALAREAIARAAG
jgi:ATP-dependent exoDNAse (exonuclease V) beta subunit